MGQGAQQQIFQLIAELGGQGNIMTIPRVFVRLTGSLDTALFLSQLLYWSDKGKRTDGFIYKSRQEWANETYLTDYAIRKATDELIDLGLLETQLHRADGAPTLHYRLDVDALLSAICGIQQDDTLNPTNGFDETDKTSSRNRQNPNIDYTETTTENTQNLPLAAASPGESDDDAAWLAESRIVDPGGDGDMAVPIRSRGDPLAHALRLAQEADPLRNWADPPQAGGADDYAVAPLRAFCALVGLDPGKLPEKKRRQWAAELRHVAEEWGVGPGVVRRCLEAIPASDFAWKTYSTPYQDGFKSDLGVLIGRHLSGAALEGADAEPEIIMISMVGT